MHVVIVYIRANIILLKIMKYFILFFVKVDAYMVTSADALLYLQFANVMKLFA